MTERLSRDAAADGGGAAQGTVRLLTVDDVRAAIACVARGEFGRVPEGIVGLGDGSTVPVDGSGAVSGRSAVPTDDGTVLPDDGAVAPEASAAVPEGSAVVPEGSAAALGDVVAVSGGAAGVLGGGSSVPGGDEYTSATLLEGWTRTAVEGDRLKALQSAQLAAFVLTRVLNRPDGEEELDDFLSARDSIDSEGKWQVGRPERPEASGRSDDGGATGGTGGTGSAAGAGTTGDTGATSGAGSTRDTGGAGGTGTTGSAAGAGREAGSEGTAKGASFGAGDFDDPRISTRARELLAPEDALILAAKLRTRLETARKAAARAVVAFLGLHNLLKSAASGRLPFERVDRLHFRVDDALLHLSHVQTLDGYLDGLDEKLSMGQFEKQARMRIRTLAAVERDPDAARKNRCVRVERRDDDTAVLEMVGPITVIEALYQRLRAMARAIRRHEIGVLGLAADGRTLAANDVVSRVSDDRRMAELIFDLLAGARPQTQLRVGPLSGQAGTEPGQASSTRAGAEGDGSPSGYAAADGADLPEGTLIDVLCPTDGDWLRKQAAVTITVPVSTVLSLDDAPGRINGDIPLGAEHCRDAAAHATSWTRVLTDPATSIVTDHVAHTYEPTAAMRRTIRQKWRTCTAPGCSRPAAECEIEHCCRFSKRDPASGGLTIMENLHVMCKHHHELKTRGIIRLTRLSRTEVAWALPVGVEAITSAPPLSTGIDPPDPQHLLARANDLDDCFAGGEANGPDLFTVVDGGRTEEEVTVDAGTPVEEVTVDERPPVEEEVTVDERPPVEDGEPPHGSDDPDCRDTTGSDSDVPPPF